MIELRKELNNVLKSIHSRSYFQRPPDDAQFPYVVYDLPSSNTIEDLEVLTLDVDVWDNKKDTTALETLTDQLDSTLHKYKVLHASFQFSIYRTTRLFLIDDDPRLTRRRLSYQIRFFRR